ncbi:uncharacterized protein DUF1127 [Shimia abyssi]|uniref:Uncharacterized protein DUF1127 n=1 Tax=Shimia abyssi TaxID=1662395 RepID=A0A2P8FHN0_9RHOB|nr:uncharacterized protein DUF1127 [Shimia abyssi]
MAYTATPSTQTYSLSKILAAPFVAFANFCVTVAESNSRMQQVQALQKLSDAELAERGLTRDTIVRFVFRDHMHI